MGFIGKAMAGAAAGVGTASLEGLRSELMAERDKRLNEYAVGMQRDVVQPFQREMQENQQDFQREQLDTQQEFKGAEGDKDRAIQAKHVDAIVKQADVAYQKGMIEVDTLKRTQQLQNAYVKETDPVKKDALADQLYTLAGKDKFTPLMGKDDNGNPVYMGAFSTRSGERKTEKSGTNAAPGSPEDIANSTWRNGKSQPKSDTKGASAATPAATASVPTPGMIAEPSSAGLPGLIDTAYNKAHTAMSPKGGTIAADDGPVAAHFGSAVKINGESYTVGSISGDMVELRPANGGRSRFYRLAQ